MPSPLSVELLLISPHFILIPLLNSRDQPRRRVYLFLRARVCRPLMGFRPVDRPGGFFSRQRVGQPSTRSRAPGWHNSPRRSDWKVPPHKAFLSVRSETPPLPPSLLVRTRFPSSLPEHTRTHSLQQHCRLFLSEAPHPSPKLNPFRPPAPPRYSQPFPPSPFLFYHSFSFFFWTLGFRAALFCFEMRRSLL